MGLGSKYIKVDIFDVIDARKVFPEILKRLEGKWVLESTKHREQGSPFPPSP
ncbi:MAG: hypothetical protein ACE5Z5_07605 [Candidatus Bathyarchaeia archaeon]